MNKSKKELRPYQQQAVESLTTAIENDYKKRYLVVIPTGGGKSLVQSEVITWLMQYDNTRILCLTHDKRVIGQNYKEFIEATGFMDAGIYSAGLNSRDQYNRVIFAGIQSVHSKAMQLGAFDMIFIDEAHRIPHKSVGTYRKFLDESIKINKEVIIAGLTATPYRMTSGVLTEGKDKIFDQIVHETSIKDLQENGFLVPFITPKFAMRSQVDPSGCKKTGGEYNKKELAKRYDIDEKIVAAVDEIIKHASERKKILVFCASIEHAEHTREQFLRRGESCGVVHSKGKDQDEIIKEFGETDNYRFLCNKAMLTTGFNIPAIDCIVLLMSTLSPGLYVQIVGRGTRLSPQTEKKDCLVLDFGSNIKTHGPVDKICITKKESGEGSEIQTAPEKECPVCHYLLHLSARECPNCGHIYERELNHDKTPDTISNIVSKYNPPEWVNVDRLFLSRHNGRSGKPDTLKISYYGKDLKLIDDYICIEHDGFAKRKAKEKLALFGMGNIETIDGALLLQDAFPIPDSLLIDHNNKYPKIIRYEISEKAIEDAIPF